MPPKLVMYIFSDPKLHKCKEGKRLRTFCFRKIIKQSFFFSFIFSTQSILCRGGSRVQLWAQGWITHPYGTPVNHQIIKVDYFRRRKPTITLFNLSHVIVFNRFQLNLMQWNVCKTCYFSCYDLCYSRYTQSFIGTKISSAYVPKKLESANSSVLKAFLWQKTYLMFNERYDTGDSFHKCKISSQKSSPYQ